MTTATHRAGAYIAAMRKRPSGSGTLWVSAHPLKTDGHQKRTRFLARTFTGADLRDFHTEYPAGGKNPYPEGLDAHLARMDGVVVVPQRRGLIGPGIIREIRAAVALRLPVLVVCDGIVVPLVDCTVTQAAHPTRLIAGRIHLPAERPDPAGATMTASLRAMGVTIRAANNTTPAKTSPAAAPVLFSHPRTGR